MSDAGGFRSRKSRRVRRRSMIEAQKSHVSTAESNEMNSIYYDDTKSDYLVWREGSGGTVEIYDLHVSGEHRREGRGRALVDLLLDRHIPKDCHLVFAVTREDNFIAQQFYEEMKFRVVAVLRDFYRSTSKQRSVAIMYGRDIGSQA